MATTAQRIKEGMEIRGYKQADLVEKTGISKGVLSSYLSGRYSPKQTNTYLIARALNVSEAWLMGADVPMERSAASSVSRQAGKRKSIAIPVYGRVAAGIPLEMIDDIIDFEEIPEDMASLGEYFALQIHGASMEPRMKEGDVVIVRQQEDAETGEIIIVTINGTDATCKRLKKYHDGIELISTNPSYETMFFSEKEILEKPVRILGKVVELRAKF